VSRFDLIIFDLDGTLIDSKQDLVCAVNAARGHMGLAPLANETIASYVGDGAPVLIRRALGSEASDGDVQSALEFFLAYYNDHLVDHTTLYPGVRETLDRLSAAGVISAILTNKPEKMSRAIVDALGVARHFERVYGGHSFEFKKPHPIGVEILLAECAATPNRALMVGDSGVDIRTARNGGIQSCGVTYGFQPQTLKEYPPDLLIDHIDELPGLLLAA
jgi:phosphoglycolate phosphatase